MPRLVMVSDDIPAPVSSWNSEHMAEAFTELREPLGRYLLALGIGRAEAEEVVQETFLRLCQHLPANGPQSNLRGWVFRVAHNLARDEHRRRRRRPAEPLENARGNPHVSRDPRATPEQQVIADESALRLLAAISRLPARQRECLHLRAEGLRYREIAEVLGAGVSTVAEWVHQALKTLVRECDENKY